MGKPFVEPDSLYAMMKCTICGGDGARHYTVTSPMSDVRSVYVCDVCRSNFFVTTDEAHEVLRKWDLERDGVDE